MPQAVPPGTNRPPTGHRSHLLDAPIPRIRRWRGLAWHAGRCACIKCTPGCGCPHRPASRRAGAGILRHALVPAMGRHSAREQGQGLGRPPVSVRCRPRLFQAPHPRTSAAATRVRFPAAVRTRRRRGARACIGRRASRLRASPPCLHTAPWHDPARDRAQWGSRASAWRTGGRRSGLGGGAGAPPRSRQNAAAVSTSWRDTSCIVQPNVVLLHPTGQCAGRGEQRRGTAPGAHPSSWKRQRIPSSRASLRQANSTKAAARVSETFRARRMGG